MARVVQRRSGPPYLLIAFVFLFLISTTFAVLLYVQNSDLSMSMDKARARQDKLASPDDLRRPEVTAMLTGSSSVITQLNKQVETLAGYITGKASDANAKEAIEMASALDKDLGGSRPGLVNEIRQILQQKADLQKNYDDSQAQRAQAQKDRDAALDASKKQQEEFQAKLAELTKQNDDLGKANQTYQESQQKKLDDAKKLQDQEVERLNKTIATLNQKMGDANWKYQQLDAKYRELIKKFRDASTPNMNPEKITMLPKGKISQVIDDQKIVYIDKGAKDKVVPGLTFSVYSGSIPEDGKNKGAIVVMNVSPSISECRIVEQKSTDPIMEGDLIGNVAYDPNRIYTFVVKGDFDLHNTGKPTPEGAKEVKDIIERSGGKVVSDISINTDFLVMGEEPARPSKLDENATPQDQAVYQAQLKAYEDYSQARTAAPQLYVPILNANKFMALVGFSNAK